MKYKIGIIKVLFFFFSSQARERRGFGTDLNFLGAILLKQLLNLDSVNMDIAKSQGPQKTPHLRHISFQTRQSVIILYNTDGIGCFIAKLQSCTTNSTWLKSQPTFSDFAEVGEDDLHKSEIRIRNQKWQNRKIICINQSTKSEIRNALHWKHSSLPSVCQTGQGWKHWLS